MARSKVQLNSQRSQTDFLVKTVRKSREDANFAFSAVPVGHLTRITTGRRNERAPKRAWSGYNSQLIQTLLDQIGGATLIVEEGVVRKRTTYLPIKSRSRTDIIYTGRERSDSDKDRRRKRYRRRKKRYRKLLDGCSTSKKCSDPSHLDGSESNDDRGDRSDRKRGHSHLRKTKNLSRHPDKVGTATRRVPLETLPPH